MYSASYPSDPAVYLVPHLEAAIGSLLERDHHDVGLEQLCAESLVGHRNQGRAILLLPRSHERELLGCSVDVAQRLTLAAAVVGSSAPRTTLELIFPVLAREGRALLAAPPGFQHQRMLKEL